MATLRGWARTASTAAKLASVEQIIGYNFKSVERLYEAMDIEKVLTLPNGEERPARRTRNTRLALVGDAAAQFHLASQWYDRNLDGIQWAQVRTKGLCNDTLGKIGFSLGLDELTVPEPCEESYAMASTVEAILGAVHYDGGEDALKRVMARCGISHRLLEVPERAWTRGVVTTSRNLPQRFFVGHQWELQSMLFRTNPKVLPRSNRSRIVRLPLDEARLVLEAIKASVEARKHAEEKHRKRKEKEAEKAVELLVEKEKKEAAQRVEKLKRRAEKARKAAAKAKEDAARGDGNGQQTSLWGNMKRLWLGSDGMAGPNTAANTVAESKTITKPNTAANTVAESKTITKQKAETISDTSANGNTAEPTVAEPTAVTEPEDTVAKSNTANGSDTVTRSNTGAEPSVDSEDTEEYSATGETLVLTAKERSAELSSLRSKIKKINKQKQSHAQQKKRSRRKGQTAIAAFESKLAELDSRLNTAKQSLQVLEKQKPLE